MKGLEELGLTKTESSVYVELLKIGSTTSGPLVKKTGLHRATVYDVLKRLSEKGIVSHVVKGKTKHFQSTSPEHLMDIIRERRKDIEKQENDTKKVVGGLQKLQKLAENSEIARMYQGVRGVKTVLDDVLEYKENLILGSSG